MAEAGNPASEFDLLYEIRNSLLRIEAQLETSTPLNLEKYIDEFGKDFGVEYYRKGLSFLEAQKDEYERFRKARIAQMEETELSNESG